MLKEGCDVQTNAVDRMSILHVCAESRDVPPLEVPYDNIGTVPLILSVRYSLHIESNRQNDNRGVGGAHWGRCWCGYTQWSRRNPSTYRLFARYDFLSFVWVTHFQFKATSMRWGCCWDGVWMWMREPNMVIPHCITRRGKGSPKSSNCWYPMEPTWISPASLGPSNKLPKNSIR